MVLITKGEVGLFRQLSAVHVAARSAQCCQELTMFGVRSEPSCGRYATGLGVDQGWPSKGCAGPIDRTSTTVRFSTSLRTDAGQYTPSLSKAS